MRVAVAGICEWPRFVVSKKSGGVQPDPIHRRPAVYHASKHGLGGGRMGIRRSKLLTVMASGVCAALVQGAAVAASIDESFGDRGLAFIGAAEDDLYYPSAPVVQDDGKILVCGTGLSRDGSAYGRYLYRMDARGRPDIGFGDAGRVELRAGPSIFPAACDALGQRNGKIIAAVIGLEVSVFRFELDGSADASFGPGGVRTHAIDPRLAEGFYIPATWVGDDGTLVYAGPVYPNRFAVSRVRPDGTLDKAFGDSGLAIVDGPVAEFWYPDLGAVVSDHAGRVLVVGSMATGASQRSCCVARLLQDGGMDPSFEESGITTIGGKLRGCHLGAAGLQADGRILVAGATAGSDLNIIRLLGDGALDASYGEHGLAVLESPEQFELSLARQLLVLDREVVLVGTAHTAHGSKSLVAKATYNGSPDVSLGAGGVKVFDLLPGEYGQAFQTFVGAAATEEGDLVVAGASKDSNREYLDFLVLVKDVEITSHSLRPFPADLLESRTRRP